ncbi:MAG TPA: phosphoribosylanthranilate isomerase [Acidisarcina sp.]|nr:phosphoribosylanthranilate isomerase [Acidisarcina sp.]
MWIKICGNTTLDDAQLAASHGADAVGFVFAPSPRRVTAEAVSRITPRLPETLEKYGVFVDADFEEIVSTVEQCGLTGVQLHSASNLAARLREHSASRLKIVQVLHYEPLPNGEPMQSGRLEAQLASLLQNDAVDAVLVDSRTADAVGGTGVSFDWQEARGSFSRAGKHLRLIAAGGLRPENVAEAISTLQPWGVDVASGVEASPGRKDPDRLREFLATARRAAEELKSAAAGKVSG